MNAKLLGFLAGCALVAAARAGTTYVGPAGAPSASLGQWFAGGSVGYLLDLEQEMYQLHAGMKFAQSAGGGSHSVFLEVGLVQDDWRYVERPPAGVVGGRTYTGEVELDIVPITLNYIYQAPLADRLDFYAGAGLGVAVVDSSHSWSWTQALLPPNNQGWGAEDRSDTRFYGNVFLGLAWRVNDSFEVFGGARYIFMDEEDHRVPGGPSIDLDSGIDGDVLIELGARFRF
jgi:opacity protein-like surface antigen